MCIWSYTTLQPVLLLPSAAAQATLEQAQGPAGLARFPCSLLRDRAHLKPRAKFSVQQLEFLEKLAMATHGDLGERALQQRSFPTLATAGGGLASVNLLS